MNSLGNIWNIKKLNRKGQTLIEVTFIFLIMVIVCGSVVDWGLGLFASHMVQNAVREAGRQAVTQNSPTEASIIAAVNAKLPATGLFSSFVDGGTEVECNVVGGTPFITVTTTGTFNFIFLRMVGLSSFPVSHTAQMRYERDLENCPAL